MATISPEAIPWVRREWLEGLIELATLPLQEASWTNPNRTNPHYSFSEFVQKYLSDADATDHMLKEGYITQMEFQVVQSFNEVIRAYRPPDNDWYAHAKILKDPSWHFVVKKAGETVNELLALSFNSTSHLRRENAV